MTETIAGSVFMSYSRRDNDVMWRIARFLRGKGIKVWVDNEKLIPGTPIWEEEIEKAIRAASAIVVIMSPDSRNSEWVRREISLADQNRKRIFPILVSGDEDSSITLRLITRQYVDLRENEAKGLDSLFVGVSQYLNALQAESDQKAREEAERIVEEKRLTKEQDKAERIAVHNAEKDRLARLEAERREKERMGVERKAKERAERLATHKTEDESRSKDKFLDNQYKAVRPPREQRDELGKAQVKPRDSANEKRPINPKPDVESLIKRTKFETTKSKPTNTVTEASRQPSKKIKRPVEENILTRRSNLKKPSLILVVVMMAILVGYLGFNYSQLGYVFAEVNGETFTIDQWQERVRLQRLALLNQLNTFKFYEQLGMDTSQQQQQINDTLESPEILGQQVLDLIVDDLLIRQESAKRNITISDNEVEVFIQESFGFYANGTPTPTGKLIATSAPQSTSTPSPGPTATPYTLDGFKSNYDILVEQLAQYDIKEVSLRSFYQGQLYRQKLFEVITADARRTEEQVWARHILVEDLSTALAVIIRLETGEDFGDVAREISTDTGSGANGGDLGWFGRGAMVTPFEDAAFELQLGEVSDPVQSEFGYHIIQVLGHEERPVDEIRYQDIRDTLFNNWLSKIRDESTIIINDNWKQLVPLEPKTLPTSTPRE